MRAQSHKRRVIFNEESRREFVNGFQKRKLARKKKSAEDFERKLKEAKKKISSEVRKTFKTVIHPGTEQSTFQYGFSTEYELPNEIVKISELNVDVIAEKNCWIGDNNTEYNNVIVDEEKKNDQTEMPPLYLLKDVKKFISKKTMSIMKNDKIFKRKMKMEKIKNKKKSAKLRQLKEKKSKKH